MEYIGELKKHKVRVTIPDNLLGEAQQFTTMVSLSEYIKLLRENQDYQAIGEVKHGKEFCPIGLILNEYVKLGVGEWHTDYATLYDPLFDEFYDDEVEYYSCFGGLYETLPEKFYPKEINFQILGTKSMLIRHGGDLSRFLATANDVLFATFGEIADFLEGYKDNLCMFSVQGSQSKIWSAKV